MLKLPVVWLIRAWHRCRHEQTPVQDGASCSGPDRILTITPGAAFVVAATVSSGSATLRSSSLLPGWQQGGDAQKPRTAVCKKSVSAPKTTKPRLVNGAKCLILLVPVNGIELLTFALRMRCSTN